MGYKANTALPKGAPPGKQANVQWLPSIVGQRAYTAKSSAEDSEMTMRLVERALG